MQAKAIRTLSALLCSRFYGRSKLLPFKQIQDPIAETEMVDHSKGQSRHKQAQLDFNFLPGAEAAKSVTMVRAVRSKMTMLVRDQREIIRMTRRRQTQEVQNSMPRLR